MPNMDPKKCPMPSQDPNVRNKNFKEVALGYTAEMAVNEAKRCLQCKKPACRTGCPVQIDIPAFIAEVAKGDFEAAYQVIAKSSALPAVCGRVCPQENQCEGKCVRGIKGEPVGIGRLERFVADWHRENVHTPAAKPEPNGHKVAVIGAGPSGLTVAGDLAKLGYKVTVYEALHVAGGVLMYGIPEFRLPKDIVQHEVEGLKELGVDIECNMVIGKVLTVDELMNDYGFEAIYIASGAGLPRFMGIPGESLKGVYSANEYLTRVNLMKAYQPGSRTPIMKSLLPGDLQNKVDPYLRPLYDALFEMLGADAYAKYLERGNIEVAPLAYMRGRTLDDSFIILDEAQNTSREQMKMFLTRIGFGSHVVITGDVTQIDLPSDKPSGLKEAIRILDRIDDIAICRLTGADVVRHALVQKIIAAYEQDDKQKEKRAAAAAKKPAARKTTVRKKV